MSWLGDFLAKIAALLVSWFSGFREGKLTAEKAALEADKKVAERQRDALANAPRTDAELERVLRERKF